jgi:hypothetical protein
MTVLAALLKTILIISYFHGLYKFGNTSDLCTQLMVYPFEYQLLTD